jgi:hypothetical protein
MTLLIPEVNPEKHQFIGKIASSEIAPDFLVLSQNMNGKIKCSSKITEL